MPRMNQNIKRLKEKGALTPGEVFATRLYDALNAGNWTQQRLEDRLVQMGFDGKKDEHGERRPKISRTKIAKLAGGDKLRYENVSLADVLAIAYALGVGPLHLMVPITDDGPLLQVAPDVPLLPVGVPAIARAWIRSHDQVVSSVRDDDLIEMAERGEITIEEAADQVRERHAEAKRQFYAQMPPDEAADSQELAENRRTP